MNVGLISKKFSSTFNVTVVERQLKCTFEMLDFNIHWRRIKLEITSFFLSKTYFYKSQAYLFVIRVFVNDVLSQ